MGCSQARAPQSKARLNQNDDEGMRHCASTSSTDSTFVRKKVSEGGLSRSMLICDNRGSLSCFYDLDPGKLGEGSYGSVCRATHKHTKADRAVKTIPKARVKNRDRLRREIEVMKAMDHPNIIKLHENFEDHRSVYLVMEFCDGGELFDRICEADHFTEAQAATLMQQVFRAVCYLHGLLITHRDLKPENFLFQSKGPIETSLLKLIDFGLSCSFIPGTDLTTKTGSPFYVAPEVQASCYGPEADLWSCGVMLFVLLCGRAPFDGDTDEQVLANSRRGAFNFKAPEWRTVSDGPKALIQRLLTIDRRQRPTAQESLSDAWIRQSAAPGGAGAGGGLSRALVKNLRGFRAQGRLKQAALHVIAAQLKEEEIAALRDLFVSLDADGDGLLTLAELKRGLDLAGLSVDVAKMMAGVDVDGSGSVDYTEFLAAALDEHLYIQEEVCWAAFSVFDRNGDGRITKEELQQALADGSRDVEFIAELMKEVDSNGDGHIDFPEFLEMMRTTIPASAAPSECNSPKRLSFRSNCSKVSSPRRQFSLGSNFSLSTSSPRRKNSFRSTSSELSLLFGPESSNLASPDSPTSLAKAIFSVLQESSCQMTDRQLDRLQSPDSPVSSRQKNTLRSTSSELSLLSGPDSMDKERSSLASPDSPTSQAKAIIGSLQASDCQMTDGQLDCLQSPDSPVMSRSALWV